MNKILLNQGWRLDYEGETLNTQIPFSLYYDLLNHKRIDDPFYRDNATLLTSLSEKDYTYRNDFAFIEEIDERKQYFLHFDRVDTISNVYLNDIHVGYTDNMFCTFEFPVNHALKKGTNHLRVKFESPIHYMNEQIEKNGRIPCNTDTLDGFPYLRKSSCMSGWDWAPRLPDMGIYKEASIVVVEKGRLSNVHIRQQHMAGRVTFNLVTEHEINGAMTGDAEKIETIVRITDPEGRLNIYENSPESIEIENPRLWWPNGLGDQPLYQVEVEFYIGGDLQDVYSTRIGLRTMTMAVERDEWGESFAHEVNGVKVFAMGADYIPEDCLVPRVNRETTKKLLTQCILANYNAVRVWGG
ncbi:MAG: glycosyl hydrolase 2 galactose-binding domain-containing protein, partial [Lacrimispora sphenoides]